MSIRKIILFLIVAIFAWRWLFPESPAPEHTTAIASAGDKASAPSYARRGIDNSWPEIGESRSIQGSGEELLGDNFYILLDASGSMLKTGCSGDASKIQVAIQALEDFLASIPKEANVGFSIFASGKYRELAPLQQVTGLDLRKLAARIKPEGSTPLRSAITFAYGELIRQGQKQLGYGRYRLIVITDGMASDGQDPSRIVRQMLQESPVELHTIGFCIGVDHVLNQPGRVVYRAANNPDELAKGLDAVLAEAPTFDLGSFED